jgi:hypothetical protein
VFISLKADGDLCRLQQNAAYVDGPESGIRPEGTAHR